MNMRVTDLMPFDERVIVRVVADKTTAAPGTGSMFMSLAYYVIEDGERRWYIMREQGDRLDFVPLGEEWEIIDVDPVDMEEIMMYEAHRGAIERAGI